MMKLKCEDSLGLLQGREVQQLVREATGEDCPCIQGRDCPLAPTFSGKAGVPQIPIARQVVRRFS